MDLHVTLAAGPGAQLPGGEPTEEIVITKAHLSSGEQLHRQLSERIGTQHLSIGGTPLQELEPGVPPLTSGAVIVASPSQRPASRPSNAGNLIFLVRSGPDAGKSVPLSRGVYTIGRSAADISIHDPELSRVHAVLAVSNDALVLRDRKSANGVWVNGSRVERSPVTTDSDIRIGASRCAVVLLDTPAESTLPAELHEPCEVSAPPPPEGNRLLILTAFLPLVLGIVLAVTTGMWFFLAFSALSAVTGLVPLINGRRRRRVFDAAVAAAAATDSERRRRAAPDPGGLALAALRPRLADFGRIPSLHSGGTYLRLGIADQHANVQPKPTPAQWRPPVITDAPVLVPLVESGGQEPLNLDICGPLETLVEVAHFLLLQLAAVRDAGKVLCFGAAADLPSAARFLPGVTLVADRARFAELLASRRYSTIMTFDSGTATAAEGMRIYRFSSSNRRDRERWTIDYFPPLPELTTPDGAVCFQPDFVRPDTFELLARAIGTRSRPHAPDQAGTAVPDAVSFLDLLPCDSETIAERWRGAWNGSHLCTSIGSSAEGPLALDLVMSGPHLLIAGTTGSGKSEFLRTLVLGLALNYSPTGLNFLFIDFKGGSGLGGLARLPHVTGMFTDLSVAAVSRTLVSLRAEIKRREALFADAGAADYLEYRKSTAMPLPRLVTVIDEFRMLSEEVPGSVQELMRIASLGRSLGMHLVLATQRPQGAITSDIRANITASVALRVQSVMESQDVLESAVAASIPVDLPGRGFLRIASGQPIEFQTATTTAPGANSLSASVTSFASFLARSPGYGTAEYAGKDAAREVTPDSADNLQALVDSANRAAQLLPDPRVRKPVCPSLPSALTRSTAVPADIPQLGLLDIPERQKQHPLVWNPARHSHLALVGQSGSGQGMVLAALTAEHLRTLPDRHLYLFDGDSNLRPVSDAAQVGAYVTAADVKRAARVLERIAELVMVRLGNPRALTAHSPHLTVFISGWGRWATAFRSSRFAWAEDALQDIVRDGEAAGIALVIAGERELIASRFFSALPNRLYLPLGASSEALLTWPRLPAIDSIPGRAFVQGRISADGDAIAQLIMDPGPAPRALPAQQPFTIAALPRIVRSIDLPSTIPTLGQLRIPVGVGGDDLTPVELALPKRTAAVVVGSAGSGKSQTLKLVAQLAPESVRCLRPRENEDPAVFWKHAAMAGAGEKDLLLVDDADLLPRDTHKQLAEMLAAGARAVFACSPSPAITVSPALASLRLNPVGIILGPRSPADGDIFGLRVDVDGTSPPGRGILVHSHRTVEIQVALCERAPSGWDPSRST